MSSTGEPVRFRVSRLDECTPIVCNLTTARVSTNRCLYYWCDDRYFCCRAVMYCSRPGSGVYSSISTFRSELVYTAPRHTVSSLYASCVAFGDKCQAPCSSRSSLRLFSVGWITVTAFWSEFRNIPPSVSSLFKPPLPGSSLESAAQDTLQTPSFVSTGSTSASASCSDLPTSPRYMYCMSSCFTRVVDKPSRISPKTQVLYFQPATCTFPLSHGNGLFQLPSRTFVRK